MREHDWVAAGEAAIPLTRDLTRALRGADCAAVVIRHREYVDRAIQMCEMADNPKFAIRNSQCVIWRLMRTPVIVDGRNVFDADACARAGLIYRGIERGRRWQ
jgi:hypothetical protein